MQLKHLQNKAIDYVRWDNCIAQSYNEIVYAYTWYLDLVSPNWEALVSEDYSYVMPLPLKHKYGIPYLTQPLMTQQLGIFSEKEINENIVAEFIKYLPYSSYEINLNEHNYHPGAIVSPNYILDLNLPYEEIAAKFSKNTQRNINKAKKINLRVQRDLPVDVFLSFLHSQNTDLSAKQYQVIKKIIEKGNSEKKLTLFGVFSVENNLTATLCILYTNHRLTYSLAFSNQEGKDGSAMFLLVDTILREESMNYKTLDFEGSRIEGVARFYRGFNAKNHPYYILKRFRPAFIIDKLSTK